jgi:hypothetical protein
MVEFARIEMSERVHRDFSQIRILQFEGQTFSLSAEAGSENFEAFDVPNLFAFVLQSVEHGDHSV